MALLPDPTRKQRREMESFRVGYACLLDVNLHTPWCGGVFIRDLYKSPDDWTQCTCPCHLDQHAKPGKVVMRKPLPFDPSRFRKN